MNETQAEKLSVIVPVYNVEDYLPRCIDSILAQSYKNIEILLIDDCSKDHSLEICNRYAADDERIIVLRNDKNSGVSKTRNNGLDHMTGEYVCFIDSDDYILPGMFADMMSSLIESRCDFAVCNFVTYTKNKDITHYTDQYPEFKGEYSSIEFERLLVFPRNMYEDGYVCSLWNKVFKREVFHTLRFDGRYAEDYRIMDAINSQNLRIKQIENEYYVYCYNQTSITHQGFNEHTWRFLDVLLQRLQLYSDEQDIYLSTKKKYCNMFLEYFSKSKKNGIVVERRYISEFKTLAKSLAKDKCVKPTTLIRYYLFMVNPGLYELAVKIWKRQ